MSTDSLTRSSGEELIKITPSLPVWFPNEERFGDHRGLYYWTGYGPDKKLYIIPAYETFKDNLIPRSKLSQLAGEHLRQAEKCFKAFCDFYAEFV